MRRLMVQRLLRNEIINFIINKLEWIKSELYNDDIQENIFVISGVITFVIVGLLFSNNVIKGKFAGIVSYSLIWLVISVLGVIAVNICLHITAIPIYIWIGLLISICVILVIVQKRNLINQNIIEFGLKRDY